MTTDPGAEGRENDAESGTPQEKAARARLDQLGEMEEFYEGMLLRVVRDEMRELQERLGTPGVVSGTWDTVTYFDDPIQRRGMST